ncbi:hypothetical protein I203_103652 [Kwoniella mangroviensis CBS 8507]|uniref:uncharacterized protein n=1 Tax=Kwoniella mangroviensis CBS 8507 TaxID=1296122 RepID=UPI00302783D8
MLMLVRPDVIEVFLLKFRCFHSIPPFSTNPALLKISTVRPENSSPASTSSEDFTSSSYSDNEKIESAPERKDSNATLRIPPLNVSEKGQAAHFTSQPIQGPDGTTLDILEGIPPLAEAPAPASGSTFGKACLRIVGIGKKNAAHAGNAITTQPSVFDTPQRDHYTPKS